ncbi:hypothetical protein HYALB_00012443 [Hymenoscyphus albidus]|uniref:Glycosyl transferase CAP10 domain-containing protein n=1 Tax=Hymenoscyphus albidus TaxID=595503 RepID=A0A9N9QAX9_9HELO|nr:hypothetical protein HYALB_00012443 [Hymenoscyphus albidus]
MKLNSPISMTYPGPPRRAAGLMRYIFLAAGVIGIMYYLRLTASNGAFTNISNPIIDADKHVDTDKPPAPPPHPPTPINSIEEKPEPVEHMEHLHASAPNHTEDAPVKGSRPPHPIDDLIEKAEKRQAGIMKKESKDLKAAAAAYRERRGRHPPPGFDIWYGFAKDHDVVMVEDFWDQIYHDLAPFWGLEPKVIRKEAMAYEMTINIRKQEAKSGSDWFWTKIWMNMTQTIEDMLPDMDIPLNAMDEPRMVAPWEEVDRLMETERNTRHFADPHDIIADFQEFTDDMDKDVVPRPKNFTDTRPYWQAAIRGCHPDSAARNTQMMQSFNGTPPISLTHALGHTYKGYVSNFTMSTDFCNQPDIQSLHGMMINPLSVSETTVFAPLFGGSKLPTNNEILLPAPMYWSQEERFDGGGATGAPWHEKLDEVIWRGVATGGKNTKGNWRGFQRHRFVAQSNGTKISGAENWTEIPANWALPSSQYHLAALEEGRLGEWTSEWSNTGFVDLMCEDCSHTESHFERVEGLKLQDQFDSKYLPDIDGNSFSGRYRGFLKSSSLPIKATIFREWHDSRLMPWVHFVPMDNRFMDFWGIIEYFLGYEGKHITVEGHDEKAEKIALAGQAWANKVLRPEDMQIYVLRLLLEYARICDERRHKMGWVEDLLPDGGV